MKVILQRDVAKLGRRHDVVQVPDGYAQNKLIPQGLAVAATPAKLKQLSAQVTGAAEQKQSVTEAVKAALAKLQPEPVEIKRDANAQGHLFQALKPTEIAAALVDMGIIAIPVSAILIPSPIKECGTHTIDIKLHDVVGSIRVNIIPK